MYIYVYVDNYVLLLNMSSENINNYLSDPLLTPHLLKSLPQIAVCHRKLSI